MSAPNAVPTLCLGCGCLCDDIRLTLAAGRITEIANACTLGERWFGDGLLPQVCRVGEQPASLDRAIGAAAELLFTEPGRLLIYVAGDATCDAQRQAVALADRLGASIDGPTSDTVAEGLLAAQRRGRASATLGELRHRADAVLFWGVDPQTRYPRFMERFVFAASMHVKQRRLFAVDVGDDVAPSECSERLALDAGDEVDALSVMRAALRGEVFSGLPAALNAAAELAKRLAAAHRYVAVVFDAEPSETPRDPALAEGLIALVQQLNSSTRAALFGLRSGGNRNGLESVLTWQTGYPFAVDFGSGFPRYRGSEPAAERLGGNRYATALVIGSPATVPAAVSEHLGRIRCVAIGPRASAASFNPRIAIDTGLAGLHEGGLLLRMDDVPIERQAPLPAPQSLAGILKQLTMEISKSEAQEFQK